MTSYENALVLYRNIQSDCVNRLIERFKYNASCRIDIFDLHRDEFIVEYLHMSERTTTGYLGYIIIKLRNPPTILTDYPSISCQLFGHSNIIVKKWFKAETNIRHLIFGTKTVEQLVLERLSND